MKIEYSVSLTYALGVIGAVLVALATIPPQSALANVDGWFRLVGIPGLGWTALAATLVLLAINATVLALFMLWLRPCAHARAQAELWAAMQRNILEPKPAPGHS